MEVPDPLAVEDLISYELNNGQKLTRLITQYSSLFLPISLTPIAEYGHQQSRVENKPKILRRRPQNPRKNAQPQSENPKLKNPS